MDTQNDQIILIFVSSAVFIGLLVILVILFLVIYQKRLVAQENRLQKLENERKQLLLKATIEGQERERRRLAKDLHDGIGSLLSGLSLNLRFQKNRNTANDEQAQFLTDACTMVEEGIQNVRQISHQLLPATLENFGLVSAVNECTAPIQKLQKTEITVVERQKMARYTNEIELGVLRIIQELIQNTLKHANATVIRIELWDVDGALHVQYADNGTGFRFSDKTREGGIGLKNIESRLDALNGTMQFFSEAGKRTGLKMVVPVS